MPHIPPPCVSLEMNLFILAAPKQASATANCNLFYLMCHSLNYHLSFYSTPLLWNEQNKTFQSISFFKKKKLFQIARAICWSSYRFPSPLPFLKSFLALIRKRQAKKVDDLTFNAVHLSSPQMWHKEKNPILLLVR